uniref:Uncharacterized protein n=1 Tax=Romanomermis culicivorax TaxID=13658 RepID=A0A915JLW4_ROMCU
MGGSYSDLPSRSSDFGYFALTFRRPDKIYLLLAGQDVVRTPSGLYQYCMISLNQNDRLRLIDCPVTVINAVRDSINAHWKLKDETNFQIAHEFKLKGYPWMANDSETVSARFLVAMILEKTASVGFPVLTSLDISRRANDKGVFVLRSIGGQSPLPTSQPSYFCISFNETDKIRLINVPQPVKSVLRNVVGMHWSAGICREQEYFGSYEMKLNGNPWYGMETQDSLAANLVIAELFPYRCLMCIILSTLEENGFSVTCSADVSAKYQSNQNGPGYPLDVHSWFVTQSGCDFQLPAASRPDLQDSDERAASI